MSTVDVSTDPRQRFDLDQGHLHLALQIAQAVEFLVPEHPAPVSLMWANDITERVTFRWHDQVPTLERYTVDVSWFHTSSEDHEWIELAVRDPHGISGHRLSRMFLEELSVWDVPTIMHLVGNMAAAIKLFREQRVHTPPQQVFDREPLTLAQARS